MNDGSIVLGYHGCDISVRDRLVRRDLPELHPSKNRYDWLGEGVYFFQDDPMRARLFAERASNELSQMFSRQPIASPAVVGAILCVSNWLDMTTQEGIDNWKAAYETLCTERKAAEDVMPENQPADDQDSLVLLRQLDSAVFNLLPKVRAGNVPPLPVIQAIRGAFYQGPKLAGTSTEFREHTHIQIALKDLSCARGWFVPPNEPPLLSNEELLQAETALMEAKARRTATKPRKVARLRA